ncbi:MAG: phosphotransferase [Pseudomonadota bacterium]
MTDFYALSADEQLQRFDSAGAQALSSWGLTGATLHLIKYRENAVYEVRLGEFRAALRVHRPNYHSNAALRSEMQWMHALADAGVATPTNIPTDEGEPFATRPIPGTGDNVQIDLFEWIDGDQLGSIEDGVAEPRQIAETYRVVGELAAKLHNHASHWPTPAGFERHAWDEHGIAGPNPLWGQFWEIDAPPSQAKLLSEAKDRLFHDLGRLPKSADQYSMIHADCVPENLLVCGGDIRLIDFDDAGWGWHLFELATALYFIQDERYFADAEKALVEGYRQYRELGDEALEQMNLFLLARGTTYLGWVHTRKTTETAQELTPSLLDMACKLADDYLSS